MGDGLTHGGRAPGSDVRIRRSMARTDILLDNSIGPSGLSISFAGLKVLAGAGLGINSGGIYANLVSPLTLVGNQMTLSYAAPFGLSGGSLVLVYGPEFTVTSGTTLDLVVVAPLALSGSGLGLNIGTGLSIVGGALTATGSSLTASQPLVITGGNIALTIGSGLSVVSNTLIASEPLNIVTRTINVLLTTAGATDRFVVGTYASGPYSYQLPATSGSGRIITIKQLGVSALTIIVNNVSDKIDGASFLTLSQYGKVTLVDYATNVWISV